MLEPKGEKPMKKSQRILDSWKGLCRYWFFTQEQMDDMALLGPRLELAGEDVAKELDNLIEME